MLPEIELQQFATALDEIVQSVLATAAVHAPPVDAIELAATRGIDVALDARLRGRARMVRFGRREAHSAGSILLRPEPRAERRQWAVAHEIGEQVAHRVFALLAVDPGEIDPSAREMVANQLAGRLLLPTGWLAEDAKRCDWDVATLKDSYATASHELIARRMLDFKQPVIVTICDQGQVTFRRSNTGGEVPPLSSAEVRCWRAAHRRNVAQTELDEAIVVRCWPVHEPEWKREITRTELLDVS